MNATATLASDHWRELFQQAQQRRQEPTAIAECRAAAMERYQQQGLPQRRQETWRSTDISGLLSRDWQLATEQLVDADRLPPLLDNRLVFVNGRFNAGLSQLQSHGRVVITTLAEVLNTQTEMVAAYLDQIPAYQDSPFAALNTAFMADGVFVHLPRGVTLEAPLQIVYYTSGQQVLSQPRCLIVADAGSEARIIEEHTGDGAYLSCPVTEIVVGDAAVLTYHKLQNEAAEGHHLGQVSARVGRDANLVAHWLTLSGKLNRTEINARLEGEGGNCTLNGLTLVDGEDLGDYHVRVEHAKPHGTSEQTFKGVLNGKSRSVFDGLIKVYQDAQKTAAQQANRNLSLSKRALAHSNPRLEILADDVVCSHGSTAGFLDPDALFYLRSRGIGLDEAQGILVYAFANEIITRISVESLRGRLEQLLAQRLGTPGAGSLSP